MSFPGQQPPELSPVHLEKLRSLVTAGFELVSFQLFPGCVGVRRDNFGALLRPQPEGRFEVAAPPAYLIEENFSALVEREGEKVFVWKAHRVLATEKLRSLLAKFEQELRGLIDQPPKV